MQPPQPASANHRSDAKDLLVSLPSVLSAAALFACWVALGSGQHWATLLRSTCGLFFWLSPLMTIYTLGAGVFYVRRRNPVGVFLALVSLPVLGFGSYMAYMVLTHGIALNTT
jgi:hypothetical protein